MIYNIGRLVFRNISVSISCKLLIAVKMRGEVQYVENGAFE